MNLRTTIGEATLLGQGGRLVCIPEGRLEGELRIGAFVHPLSGDNCSGPTLIELDGVTSDGRRLRYRTVVGPTAFAPLPGDPVTLTQHRAGPAYAIAYAPSDTERRSLDVTLVPAVRMVGKYVTVNTAIWPCSDNSLMVHYSFNSDDPRAVGGFLTLQFELPLSRLLWRRAPVITSDGCDPEAAEYVDIELL